MPRGKKYGPEEIIPKLRQAGSRVLLGVKRLAWVSGL